jgi:acetyltransferase-like isoleucine patch superfamily enzyme
MHHGLELYCSGGITIGNNTTINKYIDLDGRGGLIIGNNVSISAYCKIITASHDPNASDFKYITKPVSIEDYVWVGTSAIILPGVTLKRGCIVASGSIVTKNVAEYEIVAGNPAKKLVKE